MGKENDDAVKKEYYSSYNFDRYNKIIIDTSIIVMS